MRQLFIGFCCWLLAVSPLARAADFPLKDGDVWVMAGDSITAQHLHSNYFEAFCYARYPEAEVRLPQLGRRRAHHPHHAGPLRLRHRRLEADRRLGRAGHERQGRHADRQVHRQHGHDGRADPLDQGPAGDPRRPARSTTARMMAKLAGGNQRLHEYAVALKEFCAKEKIPYADQFHAARRRLGQEQAARAAGQLAAGRCRQLAQDDSAGRRRAPARRSWPRRTRTRRSRVSMQGDPVHPGAPGQLMMAAALLGAGGRRLRQQRDARRDAARSSRPRAARSTRSRPTAASWPSTGSTSACRSRSPTTPARCCRSIRRSWS